MRKYIFLVLLAALALSGCIPGRSASAQAGPSYQTTVVRRGDLSLSASGTGAVVASHQVDVGFSSGGVVAQVNVQPGDRVKKGQALAALDTIDRLKLAVSSAGLSLQEAQKALDDLQNNAAGNLAQALADQAAAEAAYAQAQKSLHNKGDPRCDGSLTEQYYYDYLYAQGSVNYWEGQLDDPKSGYGHDYVLQNLRPLRRKRDLAYYNWQYCQGYTDQEIAASHANLEVAQAKMQAAEAFYQAMKANQGIDPAALQIDQAAVANARQQLSKAQAALAGAVLVAPMDATVLAVNGQAGQKAGSGAFITLADLQNPQIQVNIDETDLENFQVGCSAQVTFNSLPGKVLPGVVTQVSPQLSTTQNTSTGPEGNNNTAVQGAQGLITLKKDTPLPNGTLPLNLPAAVTVTCQQVQNVLLAPLQALHAPAGGAGPSYVYVLNAVDQPEKRSVVVGLKSSAFVEIKSGLKPGERVITSSSEKLP